MLKYGCQFTAKIALAIYAKPFISGIINLYNETYLIGQKGTVSR